MRRYALGDDQWDRIKDILPGRGGIPESGLSDSSRLPGWRPADMPKSL
jgi:hypothetical protein